MAAGDNIGNLVVLIDGDWTDLQSAIDLAAAASEAGAQEIASAFTTAATQATPPVEQLGETTQHAGEEAGHAGEAFGSFGESLKFAAELAGLNVGLEQVVDWFKEFVSEAFDAANQIQFVDVALTALTGSAASASSILEHAAEVASHTTANFLDLAKSAQSMAAMGIEAGTINEALEAMAQWGELSGKSIDTLTGALERVYLTGEISKRTFVSLGVSAQDMAGVLGVSTDKVKETIKNMGAESSTTLDAFALAMKEKVGDAADKAADTNLVAMNRLKTAWHEFAVTVGESLSSTGNAVEGWAANVVNHLTRVWNMIRDPAKEYAREVVADMVSAQEAMGHTMRTATQDAENQKTSIQNLAAAANAAAANTEFLKWQQEFLKNYKDYGPAIDAADAAINKFNADQFHLNAVFTETIDTYSKVVAQGGNIGAAYRQMEAAGKALGLSEQEIADKAAAMLGQLGQLPVVLPTAAHALDQMTADAMTAEGALEDFGSSLGRNVADPAVAAMERIHDQTVKNQLAFNDYLTVYARLAASSTASSGELTLAWKDLKAAADALGLSMTELIADVQQLNGDMGNLPIVTADAQGGVHKLMGEIDVVKTHGLDMAQQIGRAIENDLSKALGDIIFQTGNISDAFKKLGRDVVDVILNHIIKDALDPLMKSLDDVLSKVFSLTPTSGAASAASSGASGAASGAGGALSGVGGAVMSGAMGWASIGIGAVSAVSGIISNFQMAHQTDILRSIELNTRETAMFIGGLGGGGVQDWLQIIATNTTPLLDINTWIHDATVQTLDHLSSIDTTLKKQPINVTINIQGATNPQGVAEAVAAYLKTISPAFSP
jgi:hypothetical protein